MIQNYIDFYPSSFGIYKAIVYAIDDNGNYDYKISNKIEII